jgi:hypothetical protein
MSTKSISDLNYDDAKKHWYKEFKILEEKAKTECDDVYDKLVFWQKEYEKFRSQIDSRMLQASGETLGHFNTDRELYLDDFISQRIKSLEREKELLEARGVAKLNRPNVSHYVILLNKLGLIDEIEKVTKSKAQTARIIAYLGDYPDSTHETFRVTLTDLRENNKKLNTPTALEKVNNLLLKFDLKADL